MYLALARKYRPKKFADVAVQSHVSNTLKGAIAKGRVAHGYLLCGPRGVGKTTLARVLAMALNCERRRDSQDGEPCGECGTCRRIWGGSVNMDVVEIDAASNRGVDDARELREQAMYAPTTGESYRIYIVDEAHMLTREAWNALLKILEEPPPRVVFVFATTEPQKIEQTAAPVLSRLQRFDFKRISPGAVRERLTSVLHAERVDFEVEALGMIARAADGSMRDALSLVDQSLSVGDGRLTVARVREALGLVPEEEFLAMLDIVANNRAADIFPAVARLVDAGVDLGGFLSGMADMLRSMLAFALGGEVPDVSDSAREALVSRKDRFRPGDILRMLSAITELEQRFRKSSQQQILIESLLVRFALMERTVVIEDLLRTMGGGGGDARATQPLPVPPVPRQPTSERAVKSRPILEPALLSISDYRLPSTLPERWSEVVRRAGSERPGMLAAALEHVTPLPVSARGEVTLVLDEASEVYDKALTNSAPVILAAINSIVPGTKAVAVKIVAPPPTVASPRRMTEEDVKGDRLTRLRKRDPNLDAAVDALDLELLE